MTLIQGVSKMNTDFGKLVRLSKDISKFGFEFLQSNVCHSTLVDDHITRDIILCFIHAQAEFDGIISLIGKNNTQPNTSQLQLRTMFENWLYVLLISTKDGEMWARYLEATSQIRQIKRAKEIHKAGAFTESEMNDIIDTSQKMLDEIGTSFNFPELPIFAPSKKDDEITRFTNEIKTIINQSESSHKNQLINQLDNIVTSKQKPPRNFIKKPLKILELCVVTDFYYPSELKDNISYVTWYKRIYSHLSDYAHNDLSNASSVITFRNDKFIANVAGDSEASPNLLKSGIAFYLGTLEYLAGNLNVDVNKQLKRFSVRLNSFKHLGKKL